MKTRDGKSVTRRIERNLTASAGSGYRFYALYDKISREDILAHASAQCRSNKGLPGVGTVAKVLSMGLVVHDRQSGADIAIEWLIGAPAGMSLTPENSRPCWRKPTRRRACKN